MLQESRSDCTFRCFSGGSSRDAAGDCGLAGMPGEEVFFRLPGLLDSVASGDRFGSTASGGGEGPTIVVVVVMDMPDDGLKTGGGGNLLR